MNGPPPAMDLLRTDVATCHLDEPADEVRGRIRDPDVDFAVVTDDAGHVLGKVLARVLDDATDDTSVEAILVEGPTSTRADVDPGEMLHRMEHARTSTVLVTTGQGELLGVLVRDDLERAVHASGWSR